MAVMWRVPAAGVAALSLVAGLALALPSAAAEGPAAPEGSAARRAEARLAFHLARAEALREALAPDVYGPCRRFESPAAWNRYLAGLVDQGITFVAHLEEAWREAKRADDPALRARVKAARRRMLVGDPVRLVRKLVSCAARNGSPLDLWTLWTRAAAEEPRRRGEVARQADLALPRS